ncbi:MAG: SIS domain-containing protein [Pelagimonas sp.]|uniref:SIS domain-containing protein n=1 Tax=Pelagimonas sp. TaxID=2073170 RepID=UPI003D6A2E03
MAVDVNAGQIASYLRHSADQVDQVAEFGKSLADKVDRIYFIGCGAPNRTMLTLEYWLKHESKSLEVDRFFPAEFMTQVPARLDDRTLIILGSKSGTTAETVAAAEFLKDKPGITVGFTQDETKPLAKAVKHPFFTGETPQAHISMYILMQAFVSGLVTEKDNWPLLDKMLTSLKAMPEACGQAQVDVDPRAKEEARLYKDDRVLYHVGSGPVFNTAYVFGVCMLQEMQWMHSNAIEAAEFFHGPFEVVDENLPLMLYLGEDPSRPLMERVVRFCNKYTERVMVYDSKDFEMKGIDPDIRKYVAPFVMQCGLDRLAERLAVWHNQPLTTRRYMWKTEY